MVMSLGHSDSSTYCFAAVFQFVSSGKLSRTDLPRDAGRNWVCGHLSITPYFHRFSSDKAR